MFIVPVPLSLRQSALLFKPACRLLFRFFPSGLHQYATTRYANPLNPASV